MNLIEFKAVEKHYGRTQALRGLDLNVPEGYVYGLLGQNGAGKSTALRLVMNLLRPSRGELQVLGHRPEQMSMAVRQQLGYSSDSMQVIPWLTVSEILSYTSSFYERWDSDYVASWLKRLELQPGKRVFSLSRGDRQKLGLVLAIGHRPRLLILDEPAGGLDPLVRQVFLESMIELLHEAGTTIVLSSHQMADLERIADHIGLMAQGRMLFETELEQLKASTRRVLLFHEGALPDLGLKPLKTQASAGVTEVVLTNWSAQWEAQLLSQQPRLRLQSEALSLEAIFVEHIQAQKERVGV